LAFSAGYHGSPPVTGMGFDNSSPGLHGDGG